MSYDANVPDLLNVSTRLADKSLRGAVGTRASDLSFGLLETREGSVGPTLLWLPFQFE